jgi:hypothetical protein
MPYTQPPELWELITAILISIVSGAIAISQRVLKGHKWTKLFIFSEFLTAILCGYLMYTAYPTIHPYLPNWCTLPVSVAFVAHSGGRIFQELESIILRHYGVFSSRPYK